MTYIELINEFWKQDRFKPFGAIDTRFYFYLLNECNMREWLNPFELQTKNLELYLGIPRKTIGEVKNRLKQRGMIDFTEGSRSKSPMYSISALSKSYVTSGNANGNINGNTNGNINGNIKVTQMVTHNKTKTEEEDLKEKPPKGGKKKSPLSASEAFDRFRAESTDENYLRFLLWLEDKAPFVASNIIPLSENEFLKLKAAYGSNAIMTNVLNIENRKDLRKRYVSLYRTLLNWCKNGFNE